MIERYGKHARKQPSLELRKAVLDFYGMRCLLHSVDTNPRLVVELHHLDERNYHTCFENLVPLCKNCNGGIQCSRYKSMPDLTGNLRPASIVLGGMDLFGTPDFRGAQACYRLAAAAHLFASRGQSETDKLDCLALAIGALRPIYEPSLLKYTIEQAVGSLASVRAGELLHSRAGLLSQMGLLLFDFELFDEAIECELAAFQLKKKLYRKSIASRVGRHPRTEEQEMADYRRRLAYVIHDNNRVAQRIRDEVSCTLDEGIALFERHGNYRGLATNLDVKAHLEITRSGHTGQES